VKLIRKKMFNKILCAIYLYNKQLSNLSSGCRRYDVIIILLFIMLFGRIILLFTDMVELIASRITAFDSKIYIL